MDTSLSVCQLVAPRLFVSLIFIAARDNVQDDPLVQVMVLSVLLGTFVGSPVHKLIMMKGQGAVVDWCGETERENQRPSVFLKRNYCCSSKMTMTLRFGRWMSSQVNYSIISFLQHQLFTNTMCKEKILCLNVREQNTAFKSTWLNCQDPWPPRYYLCLGRRRYPVVVTGKDLRFSLLYLLWQDLTELTKEWGNHNNSNDHVICKLRRIEWMTWLVSIYDHNNM